MEEDWTERVFDVTNKLALDVRARDWCRLPYPGHSRGCPNYGRLPACPPHAPRIEQWLDFSQPHWMVIVRFDLLTFAKSMKQKHPQWSEKQCCCLLYWQPRVRAKLLAACRTFQRAHPGSAFTLIPEAMGVHVFNTARKLGVPIQPRPKENVYKVALVGYPLQSCEEKSETSASFLKLQSYKVSAHRDFLAGSYWFSGRVLSF